MKPKKLILIIRDGWGESQKTLGNAILAADTPNNDNYVTNYPTALLKCTGRDVGNPESAQGGSEVGHLTIGAGRIVWQPQELINIAIENGEFFKNKELLDAIENCKKNNSALHLSGLFSDAGIHSDINQLFALMKMAKENGLQKVFVHLVLDGRDVPEKSALDYLANLEEKIIEIGIGKVASVAGRFYTMDRDTNWDRTKAGYDVITQGKGFSANSAKEAIQNAYDRGDKTDYYVQPTVILENEKPVAILTDNDSFVWFNFRTDRSRQITAMLNGLDFCPAEFQGTVHPYFVGLCRYDENWNVRAAFIPENIKNNLGEILEKNNETQLRIAETEKYAHVTFFFDSQLEKTYKGEEKIMIPSPKVPSYDLQPEMSAYGVTEKVLENIGLYDFILVNFANPDLVGHSGVFEAAKKACEVVDECVGKIVKKALSDDYYILVGADHGNAENMLYPNGTVDSSHGFNPVNFSLIGSKEDLAGIKLNDGGLKDVAPTILELMGLSKPPEMTGVSLITK